MTGNLQKAIPVLVLYKQAYTRSTVLPTLWGSCTCEWAERKGSARVPGAIDLAVVPAATDQSNASEALMILGRFGEAKKKILDQWCAERIHELLQWTSATDRLFAEERSQRGERLPRNPQRRYALHRFATAARILSRRLQQTPFVSETLVNQQSARNGWKTLPTSFAWHAQLESYEESTPWHASFAGQVARRVKTLI